MFKTSLIPVTAVETTFIPTMSFTPGPFSNSKRAPPKLLSDVYPSTGDGAVVLVCEMRTGTGEEAWRQATAGHDA